MRALELPNEVLSEKNRQEVLRAWIDGGMLSISVCNRFPERYRDDHAQIWGMLLSDIFHHVVDAVVLETSRTRKDVRESLRHSLEEVVGSDRGTRCGALKIHSRCALQLPDPDVSGDDNCVEIVRIALLPDSIRVIVLVGMWLPDNEESVWGNILYDAAAMIASTFNPERDADRVKADLLADILHYIDHPSTKYSGEYYNTQPERRAKRR
ncbi:MAG: DUF5076 domain-containing protein [Verrucomicrobia bacterium]|nr:DUF5076 domain-containing protein [Verrucomicrobiota bacterium]